MKSTPVVRCLRGEAEITLYETEAGELEPHARLTSDPPSLERRSPRRLDFDLMGDIKVLLMENV